MPPRSPTAPRPPWQRVLWARVRRLLLAKMLGTTVGISGFFVAYFWILNQPRTDVTVMPLVALDRWIALWPPALAVYLSLWVYVSVAPALIATRRELAAYAWSALALCAIGLGIFLVWPTSMPPAAVDWQQHPSMAFLKQVDAARNACPSMHVAFAVFTAAWMERLLRQLRAAGWLHVANGLWALAILHSTLATRQHVVLDVVAGAALGGVVAAASLWLLGRPPPALRLAERPQLFP